MTTRRNENKIGARIVQATIIVACSDSFRQLLRISRFSNESIRIISNVLEDEYIPEYSMILFNLLLEEDLRAISVTA